MDENSTIRSRNNALLKRVGGVVSGKDREALVLEGDRLIDDAMSAGWQLEVILVEEEREQRAREWGEQGQSVRLVEKELLRRASGLDSSPGSLALAPIPSAKSMAELDTQQAPRVLVIAGLQNPGNLGALARSAEAAGFGSIVVVAGGARPFGAKALRGSMGSLLRVDVFPAESAHETSEQLRALGYRQVCAATREGKHWQEFDWSTPIAIWVGGEAGLDPEAMSAFEGVSIPMAGQVESLNITVAASLLLFSAGAVR
ncbi:MAG: TrmH family RNA methyltransferase [Candidatus Paceibacteria bacterium]|jgi:TrmH family RNA methyltransferase